MTVFGDILDEIHDILQGNDSIIEKAISKGHFKVHDTVESFLKNATNRNPRPIYIVVQDSFQPGDAPTDLAGEYRYHGMAISIVVSYAAQPKNQKTLEKLIDEDRKAIYRALENPSSWAIVPGWISCEMEWSRDQEEDDNGRVALEILTITCEIEYREDYS